jgi:hypothetical protein
MYGQAGGSSILWAFLHFFIEDVGFSSSKAVLDLWTAIEGESSSWTVSTDRSGGAGRA